MVTLRKAVFGEGVRAVVSEGRDLCYSQGAERAVERPAHVRAASGLAAVCGKIVICQDDADFLAVLDPHTGRLDALPLPAKDGVRLYSDQRGNKAQKADLESCVYLPASDLLLAFGSGSTPHRYRIALAGGWKTGKVSLRWFDAAPLYERLAAAPQFAGSELNIEGAVFTGGTIRLFQRGNGSRRNGLDPVNATIDLDCEALTAYVKGKADVPALGATVQYDLASIAGVSYSFTDACAAGDRVYFLAAAEDSPDTYRDGPLCGMALRCIFADGRTVLAPMILANGLPFAEKAEGLLVEPGDPVTGLAAVDPDNPDTPARLYRFRIEGEFR